MTAATLLLGLRGIAAAGLLLALIGGMPRLIQLGLALGLGLWSAMLAGAQPGGPGAVAALAGADGPELWLVAARELAIGATIGVTAALPLIAAAMAGRVVDRAAGAVSRGPYGPLFSVLAAAVFVGIDGHVTLVAAIAASFADTPVVAAIQPRVMTSLARLIPVALQLAIPWLVTAAVVEIAAGVAMRLAGRAGAHAPAAAAVQAALAMMTASLVGTLAVAMSAALR